MSFKKAAAADPAKPSWKTEFENFISRWKVLEAGLSRLSDSSVRKQLIRTVREMEVLSKKINKGLGDQHVDADFASVVDDFRRVNSLFEEKKDQILEAIDQSERSDMMRKAVQFTQDPLQQSLLIDDEQAQLDMVQSASKEIVEQMKVLNASTHKLNEMIQDQHQMVLHVDKTIDEAKDDMIEGNKELSRAEAYQKEGNRCMFWILGIVGTIGIAIGTGLALVLWALK